MNNASAIEDVITYCCRRELPTCQCVFQSQKRQWPHGLHRGPTRSKRCLKVPQIPPNQLQLILFLVDDVSVEGLFYDFTLFYLAYVKKKACCKVWLASDTITQFNKVTFPHRDDLPRVLLSPLLKSLSKHYFSKLNCWQKNDSTWNQTW